MATWATAVKAQTAPAERARTRARPAPRAAPRPRVVGVVWIAALAVLLAGVVAMNVAVLRLNMTLDRLGREQNELRATNADISSRISSNAAAPRIQAIAAKRLGWVQATADETTYVRLAP
jgi:cell division protein FtsL